MTQADYAKPSMYATQQKRKKRIQLLSLFAAILCVPVICANLMARWSHGTDLHAEHALSHFHALAPNLNDTLQHRVLFTYDDGAAPRPLKHIYLQVGTFIDIKDSQHVEQLLATYSKQLHFEPLSKERPKVLRVLLGPYDSEEATKPIQAALSQRHLTTLLVGR